MGRPHATPITDLRRRYRVHNLKSTANHLQPLSGSVFQILGHPLSSVAKKKEKKMIRTDHVLAKVAVELKEQCGLDKGINIYKQLKGYKGMFM